jgi:L-alanine-DL-glutamate epimerase-like enolase superfamily enzyme
VPQLRVEIERWPFREPFRITGYTITDAETILVTLSEDGHVGRGEAAGVFYRRETPQSMVRDIESVRGVIEVGITRQKLRELLPVGGARNALDCALWDLEARKAGRPAFRLAGLDNLRPLATTYTIGADAPAEMARRAKGFADAPRLKLKLTGEGDAERVRAVRAARPDAWIGVDANQAYARASLERVMPALVEARVSLVEQPVKAGHERELYKYESPIPLAADESVQGFADIVRVHGHFDVVNIKLDKCGGLTEALDMAAEIRRLGMRPMVGCMACTSLSVAPALIVGQLCSIVDLDGPIFLKEDREPGATYENGTVYCDGGWGSPALTRTGAAA